MRIRRTPMRNGDVPNVVTAPLRLRLTMGTGCGRVTAVVRFHKTCAVCSPFEEPDVATIERIRPELESILALLDRVLRLWH